jgi:hypothetical protein
MTGWLTTGPNDFVSAPYLECPRCGQMQLGVLGIAAHLVIRRCTNCQTKFRQDLPRHRWPCKVLRMASSDRQARPALAYLAKPGPGGRMVPWCCPS